MFRRGDPGLVAVAVARIAKDGLVLVGTLSASGRTRISPMEQRGEGDELYLGGMWQPRKAVDLLADPWCVVRGAWCAPLCPTQSGPRGT